VKGAGRALAALIACGLLVLLVHAIMVPETAERRWPLALLAVASLVVFTRPTMQWILAILVPLGPVLDFFFLTPGRGIYATEVILMGALCCWLANRALGRDQSPWPRLSLPALLLVGFGLVGTLALTSGLADSFTAFSAWRALRVLLLAAGAVFLLSAVAEGSKRDLIPVWTVATMGTLLLMAVVGLIEFVFKGQGQYEVGSFYDSSIGLAVHFAFFAPLALSVWLGPSEKRLRMLGAAAWIAALICLPLTASRGALGSVFITSVLMVLITARRKRGKGWQGMAVALVVLSAGIALLMAKPEIAGEAFAYKYRASIEGDFFSTRVNEWGEAWEGIKAQPLTGEGVATWAPSVPLELARRHGVPAALLALGGIVVGVWVAGLRAWRLDGEDGASVGLHQGSFFWGLALGLVGLFLVGLAETGLGARSMPLLVWVVVFTSCFSSTVGFWPFKE
jgi:hypothetical protein